jgi:hypothetical protein
VSRRAVVSRKRRRAAVLALLRALTARPTGKNTSDTWLLEQPIGGLELLAPFELSRGAAVTIRSRDQTTRAAAGRRCAAAQHPLCPDRSGAMFTYQVRPVRSPVEFRKPVGGITTRAERRRSRLLRLGRTQRGEPARQPVLECPFERRGVAVQQESGADRRQADQ